MSSIKPLPTVVAAQIQSSATLVTLSEVINGLVHNALDSGASSVHVDIDFARGSCTVEDNGHGIAAADLATGGNLARPFHTSKYDEDAPSELHGFRGIFLASLGALSILSVVSQQQRDERPSKLVVFQGERLGSGQSPSVSHEYLRCRRHGTKVVVRDLFGNMPVRVKQRPAGEDSRKSRDRLFRNIVRDISALTLAWSTEVDVRVKGADQGQSWKITSQARPDALSSHSKISDIFDAKRLCGILSQLTGGQYGWSTWVQASARGEGIGVQGLISKAPAASRNAQFISLGVHPLDRHGSLGILYETVNNVVAASSYGMVSPTAKSTRTSRQTSEENNADTKELKSMHEHDRNPMYYIKFDFEAYPNPARPRPKDLKVQDITSMTNMLELMVAGFLENQHLHPRKRRRKNKSPKTLDSVPAKLEKNMEATSMNAFTAWNRMKAGIPVRIGQGVLEAKEDSTACQTSVDSSEQQDERIPSSQDLNPGFEEAETVRLCQDIEPVFNTSGDILIDWLDEKSGHWLLVNSRTGMIEAPPPKEVPPTSVDSGHFNTKEPSRRLILPNDATSTSRIDEDSAAWAKQVAESWKNPVFGPTEAPVPKAVLEGDDLDQFYNQGNPQNGMTSRIESAFGHHSTTTEVRITQGQLRNAKVIAQVDSKFILASVPRCQLESDGDESRPLILIDQHAADERVQLEALLQDFCCIASQADKYQSDAIASMQLEEPLVFEFSLHDLELFEDDISFFAEWGILYVVRGATKTRHSSYATTARRRESTPAAKVFVNELPSIIAERCRLDPPLLRGLMLSEVRRREEEGLTGKSSGTAAGHADGHVDSTIDADTADTTVTGETSSDREHDHDATSKPWLHRIRGCPRGLLDLINSRACRSAIMFNDVLSLDQCRDLVKRLGDTALPFQCAHGRPSLLPLASVDALLALRDQQEPDVQLRLQQDDDRSEHHIVDFAEAWKAWSSS